MVQERIADGDGQVLHQREPRAPVGIARLVVEGEVVAGLRREDGFGLDLESVGEILEGDLQVHRAAERTDRTEALRVAGADRECAVGTHRDAGDRAIGAPGLGRR